MSTRKATPDIMGDVLTATPETWNGKELEYPIEKIKVGNRLRPLDDEKVASIADSIRQIGLLNAIHLLPDGSLVAGNHRRAAGKLLGWTHIRSRIVELSEVDAELAEIDENLRRNSLTVLEEAEHLLRREELLEAKGSRAKPGDNQHTTDDNGGGATVAPPPVATTAGIAKELGISERSAQVRLQIARNLDGQVKEWLRGTELATSTTQLVELARQPAEKQRTIVDLIIRGEAANVADAVRIIDPPPAPVKTSYWSPEQQAGGATVAPPTAGPHYAAVWELESYVRDCVSAKSLTAEQLRDAVSARNRSVLMMIESRIPDNYRRSELNQAANNVAAQMEAKAAGTNYPPGDPHSHKHVVMAGTDLDPWAVAALTPGSRQLRSEALARAITPWVQEYRDTYGRNWQDLALNGNPAHTNSTFWQDIGKEMKRRTLTVDDDTLKLAIKQAFAWLLAEEPAKTQPAAPMFAALSGITAHKWEGYADWTTDDDAEYAALLPIWEQPAGAFNSINESRRITRWRVAARLASERRDNLAFSLQECARILVRAERYAAAEAARPAEATTQAAVTAADEAFGITADTLEWTAGEPQPYPLGTILPIGHAATFEPARLDTQRTEAEINATLRPDVPVSQRDDYDGDEWYTPAEYIEAARRVMGSIDLDPASCAMAQTVVKADVYLTKTENGLSQRWIRQNIWLNPPYSNPSGWIDKLLAEYDSKSPFTQQAVVLVNNATETTWFQSLLRRFPVCMLSRRIAFWRHDQNGITSRQGQAIFYLGPNVGAFINEFETFGPILRRVE
jgi:phage N-6-adenine-methyltransferase